jgi:hypothetical protein
VEGEKENFGNLKSQLYWYLAHYVNNRLICIKTKEFQEKIMQELEWVRQKDADMDGKFWVIPKHEIRENLGRSPDLLDCLAYRMYHILNDGSLYL